MRPIYLAALASTLPTVAAPPPGLLFYASFNSWPVPEIAAGGRMPRKALGGALAPGKLGQALRLDGSTLLDFPAGASVANSGTVALWYCPEAWGHKTYDNIFGLSDSNANALHLERGHPAGQMRVTFGGPGTLDGNLTRSMFTKQPITNGQWVHIAATWDGPTGRIALYRDGELQSGHPGPGATPADPPGILVGCGFSRLGRAAKGLLDDLLILDHAATPEEVHSLMRGIELTGAMTELAAANLRVVIDRDQGTLTIGGTGASGKHLMIGPAEMAAHLGDRKIAWAHLSEMSEAVPIAPALGPATHRVFDARDAASGLALKLHVQVQRDHPTALIWQEITNPSDQPATLTDISLLRTDETNGLLLPALPGRLRIFLDNGGLMGSGVRDLAQKSADHVAHGAMVLAEPDADWAATLAFVSFQIAGVSTHLRTDADGAPQSFQASCGYPNGYLLAAGDTLRSEVLCIALHDSGFAALERWADTAVAVQELQPPRHCPSGWNSWYAYRLTISEDLVLENARIIKDRFSGLGLENMQIDHGWQDRNIVGNWVANERFPHGLNWLSDRLRDLGFSLGLWVAVTQVSEWAPLAIEHPEALFSDGAGQPFVTDPNWYWEPHGKTFTLDPTSPIGLEQYRKVGEMLRSYGATYIKNDFQSNLLDTRPVPADAAATRGATTYRKAMAAFKAGMGPDMAYHACNAPMNIAAGLCDVAWTHGDLGNPGARWDWLRGWANDYSCRYHVSGKFYWSDPDYLQVGQGNDQETRVRMAFIALGGGPAFICDRLPELPEERLLLVPKCLPSYRNPARPIDLFTRTGYPRVWDLPVQTAWGSWHAVGLFNLDEEPVRITLDLRRMHLDGARRYLIWDFFAGKLLGEIAPAGDLDLTVSFAVPVTDVRVLRITPVEDRPFILATDMHLTQGGVELPQVQWDPQTLTLSGLATRAPGLTGQITVYVPRGFTPSTGEMQDRVVRIPLHFATTEATWQVQFKRDA